MLNAATWLVWALVVLIVSSATRNPLYITELIAVLLIVDATTARSDDAHAWISSWRFAAIAVPAAAIFNGLTVHLGNTVLFRLPDWLPLLGGIVTLEGICYGALNGLLLTTIFLGFTIMTRRTYTHDLVRLIPRAFYQLGVVLAIAMTYLPQTRQNLSRIREAQIIRGLSSTKVRDTAPIIVPLLVGGLERSIGLSEAMMARGYASSEAAKTARWQQAWLIAALIFLLGGWVGQLLVGGLFYVVLMVAGGSLFLLLIWLRGRSVEATRYRQHHFSAVDWFCLAGSAIALAVVTLLPEAQSASLYYSPYPILAMPPFNVWLGIGLLGLSIPALVAPWIAPTEARYED